MDLEVRRFFYAFGIIQEYNKYTTWQFLTTHDSKCHERIIIFSIPSFTLPPVVETKL